MSAIANSNHPEDKPKTSRVQSYWRTINFPWKKLSSLVMAIALCFSLTACGGDKKPVTKAPVSKFESVNITEVSPPAEIQRLNSLLERYEPQVNIVSPKLDEVLSNDQVSVKFDVKNLPIFKNAEFGLGPHVHVTLDNQEYKALYDLNQTVTFDHLSAGTHTIRAFASRPWHESFKNQGAYAQTTFHVLTKTGENTPEPKVPLLTYSRPVGTYGAEPIMLDFYLQNTPPHVLGKDDEFVDDWQVRATVDGQSFTFDRWEPIYLKGFKTGQNWVKLELLEPDGDAIANVFNSTAHVINYQPNGSDTLARLVSGEKIANIDAIVDPNYVPPTPEPTPTPEESVAPVVAPVEQPVTTPKPESTTAAPTAAPKQEETKPVAKESPVIPVVPVVPVAPVAPAPITTKIVPIAPIKAPEPIKVAPKIKTEPVKAEPIVEPVNLVVTPVPVKIAPKAAEPVKPAPFRLRTTPTTEPNKSIAPKVEPIAKPEATTPNAAKSEPAKDKDVVETVQKTAPATSSPRNYLKNYFESRKANTPVPQTESKPDAKATESKPAEKTDVKSTVIPSVPSDLSATKSTPIKVLAN
ncbi:hypothetical protein [Pseudanabaena mucicola]|uniref:FHA domain containing protein n=1 Tax=Pseudanabaena mucicola FACHB-723 TaxID=2692860 RepID=A0ABR7ZSS4_9CYAN|nr:hypothetical protein [Pseudanabaena mucicola]MBD2186981.1 hypothetical protein [Pseudanabaena mucicola FACHB-723]